MLIDQIKKVRNVLHEMIVRNEDFKAIYLQSAKLDKLIVKYYKKYKKNT